MCTQVQDMRRHKPHTFLIYRSRAWAPVWLRIWGPRRPTSSLHSSSQKLNYFGLEWDKRIFVSGDIILHFSDKLDKRMVLGWKNAGALKSRVSKIFYDRFKWTKRTHIYTPCRRWAQGASGIWRCIFPLVSQKEAFGSWDTLKFTFETTSLVYKL